MEPPDVKCPKPQLVLAVAPRKGGLSLRARFTVRDFGVHSRSRWGNSNSWAASRLASAISPSGLAPGPTRLGALCASGGASVIPGPSIRTCIRRGWLSPSPRIARLTSRTPLEGVTRKGLEGLAGSMARMRTGVEQGRLLLRKNLLRLEEQEAAVDIAELGARAVVKNGSYMERAHRWRRFG